MGGQPRWGTGKGNDLSCGFAYERAGFRVDSDPPDRLGPRRRPETEAASAGQPVGISRAVHL